MKSPLIRFDLVYRLAAPLIAVLAVTSFATSSIAQPEPAKAKSTAAWLNQMWSQGKAAGRGPVKLNNYPLRLDDIGSIIPMGMTASGHVTPSDHFYLVTKESKDKNQRYDVLAVADGHVVTLQWRPKGNPDPTVFDREVDLKVVLEHSATSWSYVDHLDEVAEFIRKEVGERMKPGQPVQLRIPVKAGQVIGKVGHQTFDFALIDTAVTLKNFVAPEQFLSRDPWKLHTVDPFDYVDEPLKSKLLALNSRKTKPFGGKIDYDIDGRLVGNWYEEGSGGYAGANRRLDYWIGHVSFVYHHIAPTNIVISIGDYDGRPRQFWVKGNAPDPAKVAEKDGAVKYELLWGQLGSSGQTQVRHDANVVQGVALAQVLPNRKLKFEIFRDQTAAEIKDFTSAAKIFER